MIIKSAAATNVGKIRSNNEDNFYLCGSYKEDTETNNCGFSCEEQADSYLFSVCDGMGGAQYGELASLLAVKTLEKYNRNFETCFSEYIAEANKLICDEILARGGKRIGTTFTALNISDGLARSYNIGDSRIYMLRNGSLKQISIDHTQVEMLIRQGIITPEEAKTHKSRHVLTQHLGIFPEEMIIEPYEAEPVAIVAGDVFLLCSDGLTDMLSDEDICAVLSSDDELNVTADTLIDRALKNGGRDNVTVLIVKAYPQKKKEVSMDDIEQLLKSTISSGNKGKMDYLVDDIMRIIREKQQ